MTRSNYRLSNTAFVQDTMSQSNSSSFFSLSQHLQVDIILQGSYNAMHQVPTHDDIKTPEKVNSGLLEATGPRNLIFGKTTF